MGCVVLGRGADAGQVERWLRAGALVPGYVGFAIGRSIFNAPLKAWLRGTLDRAGAVEAIAGNYQRFVEVYTDAATAPVAA